RQRALGFIGLTVTLACLAILIASLGWDSRDFGPRGAYYVGEVWVTEGTKLEARSGALHQEGDGGLAIRHSRVGGIRVALGGILALASATAWLLLLRQQRPAREAGDSAARSGGRRP